MSFKDFDEWDQRQENWSEDSEQMIESPERRIRFQFRFNSKLVFILIGTLIGVVILSTVLSGFIHNSTKKQGSVSAASKKVHDSKITDLYSQPKLFQIFIDNALASSVTIFCGFSSGSGWAIDLSDDFSTNADDNFPTEIVTNHHVIDGCENSGVKIVPMGTNEEYDAVVYRFDTVNDLAILITNKTLKPLKTVQPGSEAKVGQWVMAVGSPGAGGENLDGTVTTGTITNIKDGYIITDTTINPGNSGGPLLNAAGQVIAVVSAKVVGNNVDNIGLAKEISFLCDQLNGCSDKRLLQ